jgi:hypothetical protein
MPAYSFQERFVPCVQKGSKTQTIRTRRKKGFAKKGDRIYLYFGMRTKWCKKLGEGQCSDVKTIMITRDGVVQLYNERLSDTEIDGVINRLVFHAQPDQVLNQAEANAFAWADGFRPDGSTAEKPGGAYDLMIRWWKQTHSLPFIGDVIYWKLDGRDWQVEPDYHSPEVHNEP